LLVIANEVDMKFLLTGAIFFAFNTANANTCVNSKPIPTFDLRNFVAKESSNSNASYCLAANKTLVQGSTTTDYGAFLKLLPDGRAQLYYSDSFYENGSAISSGYHFMITNESSWKVQDDHLLIDGYGDAFAVNCDSDSNPSLRINFNPSVPPFVDQTGQSWPFIFDGAPTTFTYAPSLFCGLWWNEPKSL